MAFYLAGNSGRLKDVYTALEGEFDYGIPRCVGVAHGGIPHTGETSDNRTNKTV